MTDTLMALEESRRNKLARLHILREREVWLADEVQRCLIEQGDVQIVVDALDVTIKHERNADKPWSFFHRAACFVKGDSK